MQVPIEISNFFLSMQAGAAGAETLESLFLPDATYEEPFTGEMRRHDGQTAIIKAMAMGWEQPMRDMQILVDNVTAEGETVIVRWTCISPDLPGGQGQGTNRFSMRNGRIAKLITTMGH